MQNKEMKNASGLAPTILWVHLTVGKAIAQVPLETGQDSTSEGGQLEMSQARFALLVSCGNTALADIAFPHDTR